MQFSDLVKRAYEHLAVFNKVVYLVLYEREAVGGGYGVFRHLNLFIAGDSQNLVSCGPIHVGVHKQKRERKPTYRSHSKSSQSYLLDKSSRIQ